MHLSPPRLQILLEDGLPSFLLCGISEMGTESVSGCQPDTHTREVRGYFAGGGGGAAGDRREHTSSKVQPLSAQKHTWKQKSEFSEVREQTPPTQSFSQTLRFGFFRMSRPLSNSWGTSWLRWREVRSASLISDLLSLRNAFAGSSSQGLCKLLLRRLTYATAHGSVLGEQRHFR